MKIFDCHNDFLTVLKSEKTINRYITSTDVQIISAVWTTHLNEFEIVKLLERGKILEEKKGKTLLSIEDAHFISPENLDLITNIKPFSVGLVWNDDNKLGGGSNGISGLTDWGASVSMRLEENKILVDLAHSNEKTFYDFARLTNYPLFCSHTAFDGLKRHPRNLKDYQIKIIVESGGFVGLALVSEFLTEKKHATIDDVCDQILYFTTKFGCNNLGFGTDFYGTTNLPRGIKTYADLNKIEKRLLKIGFDQSEVEDIFYNNFIKFQAKLQNNL